MVDNSLRVRGRNGIIDYTVDFTDLTEQIEKLKGYEKTADAHLKSGMKECVSILEKNVKAILTSEAEGGSGDLVGSLTGEIRHLGPLMVDGIVKVQGEYARVVEFGRKSRKLPPPDELGGGEEGWRIALAIARRGTKGIRFMKRGWAASREDFDRIFERELEEIAEELAVK